MNTDPQPWSLRERTLIIDEGTLQCNLSTTLMIRQAYPRKAPAFYALMILRHYSPNVYMYFFRRIFF